MNRVLCAVLILLVVLLSSAVHAAPNPKIKQLIDSADRVQFSDYDLAMAVLDQAEKLLDSEDARTRSNLSIELLNIRLTCNGAFHRFALMRKYLQQAKQVIENSKAVLGDKYESLLVDNLSRWGEYYYIIEDFRQASFVFSTCLEKLTKGDRSRDNCLNIYSTIQYLAAIQYAEGQFNSAANQYLSSIPYLECAFEKNKRGNYAMTFRNVGQAYLALNDYRKSRIYFDKAVRSAETFYSQPHSNPSRRAVTLIVLYEAIAAYYREIHQPDSSLTVFLKALPLLRFTEPNTGRVYVGLAEAYAAVGNVSAAMESCRKAEKFMLATLSQKNSQLSKVHMLMGDLAARSGADAQALEFYNRAVDEDVADQNRITGDFFEASRILSKKQMFAVLERKAALLWKSYQQKKDNEILLRTWATVQQALALQDSAAHEFSLDADKFILAEQSFATFETGVRVTYELYRQSTKVEFLEKCFNLTDRSKGVVLLQNLRSVNRYAGVDDALIDQERATRAELLQVEQDILKEELSGSDRIKLFALRERYAAVKAGYGVWTEKIKREAPAYYKLKYAPSEADITSVQKTLLQPDEALVEFFLGDSTLTVFGLSTKSKYVSHRRLPANFLQRVSRFRELLANSAEQSAQPELRETSTDLYDVLVRDCLDTLGKSVKRLIIVPDGVLGYVPFEVLAPGGEEYLLKKYSIRYAYSASYLQHQARRNEATESFGGFIAAGDNANLLKFAFKEVDGIIQEYGRDYSVFNPATKKDFIEHAAPFNVLHLAMHAEVNDSIPMFSRLRFMPGDSSDEGGLTAIELYAMKLNANMAVLSACNTGVGRVHRGEGILSLSRAFSYAGVSSSVISLWSVPDKSTAKMMVSFYHYLHEGLPKDQALQQAKLEFIRNNPGVNQPVYWAGFVLSGDNEPVSFPKSRWWLWLGAIIPLAAISWIGFKKWRR